jgi:hypothetical protein
MNLSITVLQLAHKLNTAPDEILRICRERSIPARSPTSIIVPEHTTVIRRKWRERRADRDWAARRKRMEEAEPGQIGWPPPQRPSPTRRHGEWPADLAPMAALLNAPPPNLPTQEAAKVEPCNVAARELLRRESGMGVETANSIASRWVRVLLTSAEDVVAYWDAGMDREQLMLTRELANLGITPGLLGEVVHGRSVISRVRDGVPPEHIVRLLRDAKLLP